MEGKQIFEKPLVAFDNSELSLKMLQLIENNKKTFTKVTILHVHKPQKVYIQARLKGQAVGNYLREQFPENQNKNIAIELKQIGEKNTNVIILESFVASSSSILFLGFVGSKGFKPRNSDLSSRIRQFVYESKLNLAIVKHEDKQLGKVLFLFDGSTTSCEGILIAIAFCEHFGKQLTVLHTYNKDLLKYSKQVKNQLKEIQLSQKLFKFEQIFEQNQLLSVLERIEGSYDWIIMNRNGFRGSINKQKFVGHNTSEVLERINNNLIILN